MRLTPLPRSGGCFEQIFRGAIRIDVQYAPGRRIHVAYAPVPAGRRSSSVSTLALPTAQGTLAEQTDGDILPPMITPPDGALPSMQFASEQKACRTVCVHLLPTCDGESLNTTPVSFATPPLATP